MVKIFFSLAAFLLFSFSGTAPASYPNALALLENQPDLKIITTLVKRDSELVDLYQSVKDVTLFLAPDDTFPVTDLDVPPFTDTQFVRAILQQIIVEGVHPTSNFSPQPKYYKSKLTNSAYVDISLGAAVVRLVEFVDQANFLPGGGRNATVLDSGANISFDGGLAHKISRPIDPPDTIPSTFGNPLLVEVAPNYSILNASAFGLLDDLVNATDVTLFALTNDAFTAAVKGFLDTKQCPPQSIVDSLKYYAIATGVYYGDRFDGRSVHTWSGDSVTLSGVERFPELKVNDANVAVADVFVKNGVVHVLDSAISPNQPRPIIDTKSVA